MANYQNLKAAISAAIRTNGNQEITGQVLQDVLNSIVSVIGANYTFAGVATPATNPGTPDQNVIYLAMEGGTYTNFNGTVLPAGISLLMWNGSWTAETIMYNDGGVFDISVYKSTGGTLAKFADLAAALNGGNNIPVGARKGGMSVKFVQSSDNKYVQYMCKTSTWSSTPTDWEKVNNVSVSQNTNTGHTDINIGDVAYPVVSIGEYLNLGYYLNTEGAYTVNRTLLLTGYILKQGGSIKIKFTNQNAAVNPTLNISYTGAFPIYYNGKVASPANTWDANEVVEFYFDGTNWIGHSATYGFEESVLDNAESWLPNHQYRVGDKVKYLDDCYVCKYEVSSSSFPDWAFSKQKNGGTILAVVNRGGKDFPIYSNCVKLNAMTYTKTLSGITAKNQVYYNTNAKKLYVCTNYTGDLSTSSFEIMPFKDGAVYSYNDALYVWNGTDMVLASKSEIESIAQKTFKDNVLTDMPQKGKYPKTGVKAQKEASSVENGENNYDVEFRKIDRIGKRNYTVSDFVAVNHDDMALEDVIGVRKIYNKYGFNANFNFILEPFTSEEQKAEYVENVRQLIADGNDIGLHAIFHSSYWWVNPLVDERITGNHTFCPTLSEIKTVVANNKNIFGFVVADDKLLSQMGFADLASSYNKTLSTATSYDVDSAFAQYSLYQEVDRKITGLDLDGNIVEQAPLYWLEYWYNELIDNQLGYTSQRSGYLTRRFFDDYDVPEGTPQDTSSYDAYYPDATHLLNGKMVFFDDTENPHYNDSDYQKVGRFNKGLFKGCASNCNFEVIDRVIEVAKAFCRHYFGFGEITNVSRHGQRYITMTWKDTDGFEFENRELNILSYGNSKLYSSRLGAWRNHYDILLDKGIKNALVVYATDSSLTLNGQCHLFKGRKGVVPPFFNAVHLGRDVSNYLELIGSRSQSISYDTFINYFGNKENWLKFAYENAGTNIQGSDGNTIYLQKDVKRVINAINASIGTGKVTFLTLDTIGESAATLAAVEMVCQYCYANNIVLVPLEKSRCLTNEREREYKNNYYPNPTFNQSLINYFGGSSSDNDAYLPDGMYIDYRENPTQEFSVDKQTVNENELYVFTIDSGTSLAFINCSLYGLPSGKYKFSIYAKGTGTTDIKIYKFLNGGFTYGSTNGVSHTQTAPVATFVPTGEWTLFECEFEIDEPHRNISQDTVQSKICDGYEDNVQRISIDYHTTANSVLLVAKPIIKRI